MLYPDDLDDVADAVTGIFDDLEEALRTDVAVALARGPESVDRAAVRAMLAARSHSAKAAIERVVGKSIRDAAHRSLLDDEKVYSAARVAGLVGPYVDAAESKLLERLLKDGIASASSLTNLVRTSAEQAVFLDFTDALDKAMLDLVTNTGDPTKAVRNAVREIAGKQTAVTYTSATGRRTASSVYGAARRAIITGANQTTLRIQEARMIEVGASMVEVSAHMGARPDHAEWQGEVMPFSELGARTGYGDVEGLGGANCRHTFGPYFEGIMQPTDFGFDLGDEAMNEEQYALSQRQRESERKIRGFKARANIYREAAKVSGDAAFTEDAAKATSKVREWQAEADRVAGLRNGRRRPEREIAAFGRR